jgi:hypothetical protein
MMGRRELKPMLPWASQSATFRTYQLELPYL